MKMRTDVNENIYTLLNHTEDPLLITQIVKLVQKMLKKEGADIPKLTVSRHVQRLKDEGKLIAVDSNGVILQRRSRSPHFIRADRQTEFLIKAADRTLTTFQYLQHDTIDHKAWERLYGDWTKFKEDYKKKAVLRRRRLKNS